MQLLDVSEKAKERKKGQRRIDLFRRENLETWILCFPPGDVQVMHNHPSDRTYYVLTGKGVMKGLNESHEVSQGQIISIPAHEFYEGSNPYDEPMILLGNSHKATAEDVAKAGGQRNEIDKKTGKRIIYQHGGGQDMGVLGTRGSQQIFDQFHKARSGVNPAGLLLFYHFRQETERLTDIASPRRSAVRKMCVL